MSFDISQYMVFLAYQTLDERGQLRHYDEYSVVKGAVMRPQTYSAETIANLIRRHTVVTLEQMQRALDDGARRTVFRKLEQLDYRSSYSHCGRYYTLTELARFDVHGLWEVDGVRFSVHGSLAATAEALVPASPGGLFAAEFDARTGVATSNVLGRLAGGERLARERLDGRYLYCAGDKDTRGRQLRARTAATIAPPPLAARPGSRLGAAAALFFGLLNERQRRLYAGLESARMGRGGDRRVARALGLDPATVSRGRHELLAGETGSGRVRKPGGGRKRLERKRRSSSTESAI